MKLEKLSQDGLVHINGKKIICYGCSAAYLGELEQKFPYISERITAVYDGNVRQRTNGAGDGRFPVISQEQLTEDMLQSVVWLILSDYFQEAYERLSGMQVVRNTSDTIYYFENYETEIEMKYRRKYGDRPLENLILFRSGPHSSAYVKGMDFSDNARALFEYMLANQYNETYELVWLVKDPAEFSRYSRLKNVSFAAYDWSVSECQEERYITGRCVSLNTYFLQTLMVLRETAAGIRPEYSCGMDVVIRQG